MLFKTKISINLLFEKVFFFSFSGLHSVRQVFAELAALVRVRLQPGRGLQSPQDFAGRVEGQAGFVSSTSNRKIRQQWKHRKERSAEADERRGKVCRPARSGDEQSRRQIPARG